MRREPVDVVFVTQFFPPETGAGARRAGAIADALLERCRTCIVTLEPGYPDAGLYAPDAARHADAARRATVVRRPAFPPHEASFLRRAVREVRMSADLLGAAREWRPRVLVASTPSMFLAPFAWWAARRAGARFAWDLRDLTWRYALESGRVNGPQRVLLRALEWAMLALLRRADLVIAATPGLATILRERGIRADRLVTVTNGVSRRFLDAFDPAPPPPSRPRPRVTYVGLMGYNHGVGVLLDMARELPGVDVHLVGDGPDRAAVEARARALGLANVTFHGYVTDFDRLAAHYRESDLLLAHTRATPTLDRIVLPAKTFEYLATGRPVVYAGAGDTADMLRSRGLARVVPPDDAAALAAAVREVLADPRAAAARAANARAFVAEEHCRERQMGALADLLIERFGIARPGATEVGGPAGAV